MNFAREGLEASAIAPAPDEKALLAELTDLQALVARTRSIDAVENLLQTYAYYLDECMVEQAAQLFSDRHRGRHAIALSQSSCPADRRADDLTLHHILQPVITLSQDGRRATVVGKLWQVHATAGGIDEGSYSSGTLVGEASLQGDRWSLTKLSLHRDWTAPQKEGFARAHRH